MKYFILFFISIVFSFCTTIKSDRPYIPGPNYTKENYPNTSLSDSYKLEKGSLLILIQSKRGVNTYTPDISGDFKKLESTKYFDKVVIKNVEIIDLKTINKEAINQNKYKYLLVVSYYSNNSVSQSKFHTFLKTATLNLYDFFPIFSPIVNTFNLNYSFTLEASLIDAKTSYVINNYKASEHIKKGIKGGRDFKNLDNIYIKSVIDKVSKKLLDQIKA